jgi:aryl-alcohol dehydrogenase-like predicted oxidoreductase
MKPLKQENLEELKVKVLDLIAKTSVEIGQKPDRQTMAGLSKVFAQDLIQEKRFGNMTFNQIEDAFRLGVRFGKEEPFLNIRTFYRWAYAHKKVIDNAWYEVHTLGKSKQETLYYQEPLKLLR